MNELTVYLGHTTLNKVKVVETMVEYVYESQLLGI